MKRHLITLAGAIGIIAFIIAANYQAKPDEDQRVTSYEDSAAGLSEAAKSLRQMPGQDVVILGQPLISAEQLAGVNLLIMTSIVRSVTDMEAELIHDWVEQGGHLLVSYHNQETYAMVYDLFRKLKFDVDTSSNKKFLNQEIEAVRGDAAVDSITNRFYKSDETYGVYSPLVFDDEECLSAAQGMRPISCFSKTEFREAGTITLILGFPFFANGLLHAHDNIAVSARIFASFSTIAFDEFHQFFSDRTLGDLFVLPAFVLPLFGLIITVLAFFFFGPTHQVEPLRLEAPEVARGYHDVNVALLNAELQVSPDGGVNLQHTYLSRNFAQQIDDVKSAWASSQTKNETPGAMFWRLSKLHRRLLIQRGRKQRHGS